MAEPQRLRASVCIPTHNRADILRQTLESLNQQSVSRDRFQVVVGDDASTDGTLTMLQGFPANFDLRWAPAKARGAGAARNAAAGLATHEVLIFLDDDQITTPDLVAAHLEAQERCGIVAVQGDYPLAPGRDRNGATLIYERARSTCMGAGHHGGVSCHLWGGIFSLRRETWVAVGGFDENLPRNQDLEFGLRLGDLGVRLVDAPKALSYHLHGVSIAGLQRQSFDMGRCFVRISRKRGVTVEALLGSPLDRKLDRMVSRLWLRSARWARAVGRTTSSLLWAADRLEVTPAQFFLARVIRRFHMLGGIALETASIRP